MEISNESIFVSALRTFCRSVFSVCGIFFGLLLCFIFFFLFAANQTSTPKMEMVLLPDLEGDRERVSMSSPVILRINIHGMIGDPKGINSSQFETLLLESREGLLKNDRIKGILLHFNTPGGAVVDSYRIYELLSLYREKYKVPIFGYVEGLCASGGMYISCAADRMFSSPVGLTGSIGVILGPYFNVTDLMETAGVKSKTISKGLGKDQLSMTRPWEANEGANMESLVAFYYSQFVDIVTKSRPQVDRQKLVEEYGAQVFDGTTAQKIGYIDVADTQYNAAMLALLKEAEIDTSKPYQVVSLEMRHNPLSDLLQNQESLLHGKIRHLFPWGEVTSTTNPPISYLYQ